MRCTVAAAKRAQKVTQFEGKGTQQGQQHGPEATGKHYSNTKKSFLHLQTSTAGWRSGKISARTQWLTQAWAHLSAELKWTHACMTKNK